MEYIIPAILPKSFQELEDKVDRIVNHATRVQLDICDGGFVDATTWPYTNNGPSVAELIEEGRVLLHADTLHYCVDLMVSNPEEILVDFIELGATRLTIHFTSTKDFRATVGMIRERYGYDKEFAPDLLSVGMAVPIGLSYTEFAPFLDLVDFVQFMGIVHIGRQGQPFDKGVVVSIREFHKRYPDVTIQVDGGVSLETAPLLLDAGADRLAVGSALFGSENIGHTMREFQMLFERYGIYE